MRTLVPAETLVYLETNDLAAALQPIINAKPFLDAAKSRPDLSALKGVQLAVAVTGFETREEKLTDEHSVGRVQPRFVAVADTHSWNSTAVAFAEKKLGSFVENIYNNEPTLEKSDKHGGKYFTWTAADGRKAYALVIDSVIYFGNDETSIEKCLAVKRGEADSILKTEKIKPAETGTLAQGYVSQDGIAQIAGLIGLKFASETSDESEVKSAIVSILPQLIRNSITEMSWTSTKTENGVEDRYAIGIPTEMASVFSETMKPGGDAPELLFSNLPDAPTTTRYNLKDPQVAWRSILLTLQKHTDTISGKIIGELANSLFEPYGITDPEQFLSAVDSNFLTTKVDIDGDEPFVTATMRDEQKVRNSVVSGLKTGKIPTEEGVFFWRSEDNEIEAVFHSSQIIIGSIKGVGSCFSGGAFPHKAPDKAALMRLQQSTASLTTIGHDTDTVSSIVEFLSAKKYQDEKRGMSFHTETRFIKTGIDRRTTSDFGLIGSIIAQLGGDD